MGKKIKGQRVTRSPYEQISKNCLSVYYERTGDWKKHILLTSDWHWDNPKCQRELLKKDLDLALKLEADVIVNGDLFCFMQGTADPRRTKSDIRPEHNVSNYFDAVIEDCANWLKPYYPILRLISRGNHETKILKHQETDVTDRLAQLINAWGGNVYTGNYAGYVWFQTEGKGGRRHTKKMFYHHGKFGGIISKGTQGASRYASVVPDADIVTCGHTHDHWSFTVPRYRLRPNGDVVTDDQIHLKTGTYKDEQSQLKGWHTERIFMPKSYRMWYLMMSGNTQKLNDLGYFDTQTAHSIYGT